MVDDDVLKEFNSTCTRARVEKAIIEDLWRHCPINRSSQFSSWRRAAEAAASESRAYHAVNAMDNRGRELAEGAERR
jgi:hypothetical protein